MTQAQRYLGMWDFGEPGHSVLGNLCRLRQVSHASMEADVALVGDSATFGVEMKQSQTRRSALWRCTVGWTHPVCLGMWDLSACMHPAVAFLVTQQPNVTLVLIHGTKKKPMAVCVFPVSHRLWHYITDI